jgi:glycerophosphoryl diester phosphodiesterase
LKIAGLKIGITVYFPASNCTLSVSMHSLKIIGHRGARGLAPENTIASIDAALLHGVDEVEIDVRVTHDGVAVLAHNATLVNAAGKRLNVVRTGIDELRRHNPGLPTLEAAITAIGQAVPLVIEIKPRVATIPVIAIIREFLDKGWQADRFRFASRDQKILRELHAQFPDIEIIVNERWSSVRAQWRAQQLGTKRISMNAYFLWRGFLRMMHRAGYQISPYTVNNPKKAAKWAPYIYGVFTDHPERFET